MSIGWPSGTLTVALLAVQAASALGATVTDAPTVSGDPSPGSELTATAGAWTPAGATASYDWLRCDASGDDCTPIPGSCDLRYTVRDSDLGHTLRARLTVVEAGQEPAIGRSDPTAVVVDSRTPSRPAATSVSRASW